MSETMGTGHDTWIPEEGFELMSAEEALADIDTELGRRSSEAQLPEGSTSVTLVVTLPDGTEKSLPVIRIPL